MITAFERVYYLNLDRSPERRRRFVQNVAAIDWALPKPRRFAAIVGQPVPSWYKAGVTAWSVLLSHLAIYQRCILDGVRSVLIFEDDCLFPEDFGERLRTFLAAVPDDWDQLYLGGGHSLVPEVVNDKVLRSRCTCMCIAYAVRGTALAAPLTFLARFKEYFGGQHIHIDAIWSTLHKHRRVDAYCPWDWITGQAANVSDRTGWVWQEEWFPLPIKVKRELKERLPC